MQDVFINHPYDIYFSYLKNIRGKEFTSREIDIIACITCGRSATVSSFLSIAPKTVSAHIGSILQKIEGNSREDIISFIEKSNQYAFIKKYYQSLVIYFSFETYLLKNFPYSKEKSSLNNCSVNTRSQTKELMVFIKDLEKHLCLAGIRTSYQKKEKLSNVIEYTKSHPNECVLYLLSENELELLRKESDRQIIVLHNFIHTINKDKINDILILMYGCNSGETKSFDLSDSKEFENYYFWFFEILNKISSDVDSNQLCQKFMQFVETLGGSSDPLDSEDIFLKKRDLSKIGLLSIVKTFYIHTLLILASFFFVFFYFFNQPSQSQLIRSDLRIPTESVFLNRSHLITEIKTKLSTQHGVQRIALVGVVGIGGVGKTTVARQFGRLCNSSLVWEINAETKSSLVKSFKDLAYVLAKTPEQRNELEFIQKIQNSEERETQFLYFIRSCFKKNSNWLLIFDNLGSFSDIKPYFPEDSNVWGEGKVIITTRDSNIKNTGYVRSENVIELGELSKDEALTLLSRILYNCEDSSLSMRKKEEAGNFLKNIPPFPLDITVAAYYIKNAGVSFKEYLNRASECSVGFEDVQESLLAEVSDYTKTRFGVIKLSFQSLIETNLDFKDFLLRVCLLDSQNIPKSLLESYKNPVVFESFVHELKRYSLITTKSSEESEDKVTTFSIHRSTQNLGRVYLLNLLSEAEKKVFFDKMISGIQSFYELNVEKNHSIIRSSIPHLQSFLKTLQTTNLPEELKDKHTQDLLLVLSNSHARCFRNLILEKQYFSEAYHLQKKTHHFSDMKMALLLKNLASTCADLEHADETAQYAQASIKILKDVPQSEMLIAENFRLLGYAYTYKNDFEQAQFFFKEALKMIAHLDFDIRQETESDIYAQLAWLYGATYITGDRAADAKKYIHKALEIMGGNQLFYNQAVVPQKTLSRYIARHKTTLGEIYCRLGEYKEAVTQGFREVQYIIDHSLDNCPHYLLKVYTAIGMGEVYLREGHLEAAKNKLMEAIRETEKLTGKGSALSFSPKIFCVEARIRLGELVEAYEECLEALKIEKETSTNHARLMHFLGHYYAAIIQYKLGNFKKSLGHFCDFFREIKPFSMSFFDKKIYEELDLQETFCIPENQQSVTSTIIQQCLQKSRIILINIYGDSHPFIKDFVLKNEKNFNAQAEQQKQEKELS